MYVAPADRSSGPEEWRPFVEAQGFGHLVAVGSGRDRAVIVPTQFVLDHDAVVVERRDVACRSFTVYAGPAWSWWHLPSFGPQRAHFDAVTDPPVICRFRSKIEQVVPGWFLAMVATLS